VTSEPCPEWAEARRRFADCLRSQGWPEAIQWVGAGDVQRVSPSEIVVYLRADDDGTAEAERLFERGRRAGLGVMLDAVCTWGDVTCATVSSPRDEREGELERCPPAGLKLSVAVPRLAGTARWPAC
jgi:hypothetical protein